MTCACSIDSPAKLAEKRGDFGRLMAGDQDFKVIRVKEGSVHHYCLVDIGPPLLVTYKSIVPCFGQRIFCIGSYKNVRFILTESGPW